MCVRVRLGLEFGLGLELGLGFALGLELRLELGLGLVFELRLRLGLWFLALYQERVHEMCTSPPLSVV